jgi:hypothetical protein
VIARFFWHNGIKHVCAHLSLYLIFLPFSPFYSFLCTCRIKIKKETKNADGSPRSFVIYIIPLKSHERPKSSWFMSMEGHLHTPGWVGFASFLFFKRLASKRSFSFFFIYLSHYYISFDSEVFFHACIYTQ